MVLEVSMWEAPATSQAGRPLRKRITYRELDLNSPPRGGGGPEAGNADLRPTHEKASFSVMSLFGRSS
jgi:hypothetical protein